MAKTLQFRRGTTAELSSVTGAVGELFVDTTKDTVVVMDGSTPGGKTLATEEFVLANGGTGGSYDQSLNTTDDVVFNSALVGDVSIVGNTVSGVDSYGNADTLVVDGGLQVITGSVTQGNVITTANVSGYIDPSGPYWFIDFYPINNFSPSFINTLLTLPEGSEIIFYNLNSSSFGQFYKGVFTKTTAVPVGADGVRVLSSSQVLAYDSESDTTPTYVSGLFFADSYVYPGTVDTTANVLNVTSTGVDVAGALTVNGQNVSFDQDLNTTDDVVFNSALVGDVSIINNEISGADSYGNPASLKVTSDLTVEFYSTTTNLETEVFYSGDVIDANIAESTPSSVVTVRSGSSYLNTWLSSMSVGDSVKIETSSGSVTVVLTTPFLYDPSAAGGSGGYVAFVDYNSSLYGTTFNITLYRTVTTGSTLTPLSVTESGVNVEGTLTVNGQPVGGGSSYDQDLNTTDDVVFNSALVGDVSIVGNTIAGVDSYGNADALVVDGDLTVQHTVETVTVLSGLSYDSVIFEATMNPSAGGQVHFQDYGNLDSNTESTLLALTAGQQITLIDNASVSRTYTVVGTATQVGMGGTDVLVYVQEPWIEYVIFPSNGNITVATTTTTNSLSVTDSAVVVDGNLVPATDMAYSLGSPTKQWKDLYVSTNTIYIGGTPITVEGGELKVDGVSLIESNYVGSKAITAVAPVLTTTTWSNALWFEAFAGMSQTSPSSPIIEINLGSYYSQEFIAAIESLQAGDIVSSDNGILFTLDGPFVNYGDPGAYLFRAPLATQTGVQDLYVFENNVNLNKYSEQSASFSFAADGNFAAPSVLADSALIGDVSITGNTIAGVDSYGLASDLILEGTVVYAGETSEIPVTPGSVNKWLKVGAQVPSTILVASEYDSINWMNGATYNSGTKTLSFDGITGTFQTVLQSLSVADTLRIYVPTYGSWFTLSLSSQFTEQGSPGPWTASVNEDVFGTPDTASITLVEISLPSNTGPLETQYFYMPLYK